MPLAELSLVVMRLILLYLMNCLLLSHILLYFFYFGNHIYGWYLYTSLIVKFGMNRTFHFLKTPIYRFHLHGRYQTLSSNQDNFLKLHLELVCNSKYQIRSESNATCTQDPVYRFDLYGRYRTLWSNQDNYWYSHLELVNNPICQI